VDSVHEARNVERKIISNHIDDPKCLNTQAHTSIATPKAKQTTWNGQVYSSLLAAERDSQFSAKAIKKAIRTGMMSDADLIQPKLNWNGKTYENYTEAAKDSIYNACTIKKHVMKGKKSDTDIMYEWNGKHYKTAFEMLSDAGADITQGTFLKWYRLGVRSDLELTQMREKNKEKARVKGKSIEWNGTKHVSISAAYRSWDNPKNLTITMFRKYLAKGYLRDSDIPYNKPGRRKKK
jgi:hypothetical protein